MMADPRKNIAHDVEVGQVYRDSRTDEPIILTYIDSAVYLLRDEDGNHRIGRRKEFDVNAANGRFKLDPDAEWFGNTGSLSRVLARAEEYEEKGGRKYQHYADAMHEAVSILTDEDAGDDREPVPFEELDGIGDKGADNLRSAGYQTKGDIRHADDSELTNVAWVGDKGATSIREYVEG